MRLQIKSIVTKTKGGVLLNEFKDFKTLSNEDLMKIFPFGKTKMNQLLQAGILPVVKIGKHYLTTEKLLNEWFEQNRGKELFY